MCTPSHLITIHTRVILIPLYHSFSLKHTHTHTYTVKASRETAEFRGSDMYAAMNAHLKQDLGRRDDMWSLFYVCCNFYCGDLGMYVRVCVYVCIFVCVCVWQDIVYSRSYKCTRSHITYNHITRKITAHNTHTHTHTQSHSAWRNAKGKQEVYAHKRAMQDDIEAGRYAMELV
jgi:hypothetical protein